MNAPTVALTQVRSEPKVPNAAPRPGRDHEANQVRETDVRNDGVNDAPQVLLRHHLKKLRLPTFNSEYGKLARQCEIVRRSH